MNPQPTSTNATAITTKSAQRTATASHSTLAAMVGVDTQKINSNNLPCPGTTPSLKRVMPGKTYTEVMTGPPPPQCDHNC